MGVFVLVRQIRHAMFRASRKKHDFILMWKKQNNHHCFVSDRSVPTALPLELSY